MLSKLYSLLRGLSSGLQVHLQILDMHTPKQNRHGVNPQEKLVPASDLERL